MDALPAIQAAMDRRRAIHMVGADGIEPPTFAL